jgi:hypothetical protein
MPIGIAGVAAVVVLFAALIQPEVSSDPLAADNPGPNGAMAVVQVLRDHGVRVTETTSLSAAVDRARPGTTLAVVGTYLLSTTDVTTLARTSADLVVIDPEELALTELSANTLATWWDSALPPREAGCDDPDAEAAGTLSGVEYSVVAVAGSPTICFGTGTDPDIGAYAVTSQNGRPVRVIADSAIVTNATISQAGNAALALRALGKNRTLTWYRPTPASAATAPGGGLLSADALPPATGPVLALLALVVVVAALWRARAFGRVVGEPLPVTVRAAETAYGRGRLYRRARSRAHAAAALRAATARRSAARLGLPRSAGAEAVIAALGAATGRGTETVASLLYGPPPTDDVGLLALAQALDELESEVHRT